MKKEVCSCCGSDEIEIKYFEDFIICICMECGCYEEL